MRETPAIGASGLPGKRVEAHRAGITITLRMNAADSINASDRDLMRRVTIVAAAVFVFTAAFAHLERTYSQKFLNVTGHAKWIWAPHRMSVRAPQGAGGLLASIDIHPEVANFVVTDAAWKIYRSWTPEILLHDVPSVAV